MIQYQFLITQTLSYSMEPLDTHGFSYLYTNKPGKWEGPQVEQTIQLPAERQVKNKHGNALAIMDTVVLALSV